MTATKDVDLSEFFKLSKPRKPPCRVGFAAEQLKPAERSQLDEALRIDQGIITNQAIAEWLAKRGHEVTAAAVVNHRRTVTGTATNGKCSCADA